MSSEFPGLQAHRRRGPSRGFWYGMLGVLMFALVLTGVGIVGAAWDVEVVGTVPQGSLTPVPTIEIAPRYQPTTPPDNVTLDLSR